MTINNFENLKTSYLSPKSASNYAESLRIVKDRFLIRIPNSKAINVKLLRNYLWESFASKLFKSSKIIWGTPAKKKAVFFKGVMISPVSHVVFHKINAYSLKIEALSENIYAETIYTVSDLKKGFCHVLITPTQWLKTPTTFVYARINQHKLKKAGHRKAHSLAKQISDKFGVSAFSVKNIFSRYLRKAV